MKTEGWSEVGSRNPEVGGRRAGYGRLLAIWFCFFILHSAFCLRAPAQGTAFTYQGRLGDGGAAANGSYDLRFTIYDSGTNGSVIAGPLTNASTIVSNGLFTVALDFGPGVFTGPDRWLEIGARTNGAVSFATLAPRQKITATPYAVTAGGLSGTVPFSQLPAGILTNNQSGIALSGTLSGNGAGLTNVNAATLGGIGANGFWRTAGNAGTTAGVNYIGTSDNQPLEIQVNATRALRIEPHGTGTPSLIGGYYLNSAAGYGAAVIAGGGGVAASNVVNGDLAFIGAGYGDSANLASATIAGGYNNAQGVYSFVGSGAENTNAADFSFLGGGQYNFLGTNSPWATMGGGYNNAIQANSQESTIAGGHDSVIQSARFAFIGGGGIHMIQSNAYDSAIVGGGYNTIQTNANGAAIGGGYYHTIGIGSTAATIDGGYDNTIGGAAQGAKIGGGYYNTIGSNGVYSVIAGGYNNNIQSNSYDNVIVGGHDNIIQPAANFAFIGAGGYHQIQSNAYDSAIVAGGYNTIQSSANGSFIGGGYTHTIETNSANSVIGGGYVNTIEVNAYDSFIGGGYYNSIQSNSSASAIAGGLENTIGTNAYYSFVGGGYLNTIQSNAPDSTIAGGVVNTIQTNAYVATIGGGYLNVIQTNAFFATIPGGYSNTVAGPYGFAAGQQAQALHQGSFVWADLQNAPFASTVSNQFNVRAQGGVRFVTGGTGVTVDGQPMLSTASGPLGLSIQQNSSGAPNVIEGSPYNFVAGGIVGATISGGGATNYLGGILTNSVAGNFDTVGGGGGNIEGGTASVISGGMGNTNQADYSFIGGGFDNLIQSNAFGSAIAGGFYNAVQSNASYATIAGGIYNTNNALGAAVGGGGNNNASGQYSTAAGGYQNSATGQFAVSSGGRGNQVTNLYATVPGGNGNIAGGSYSFAAGQQAQAVHQGAFVWADSENTAFSSTISNQFSIRAGNGLRVSDGTNGNFVAQMLHGNNGDGYQALNFNGYFDQGTGFEQRFNTSKTRWRFVVDQRGPTDLLTIDNFNGATVANFVAILTNGNVGIGTTSPTNKLQVVTAYCTGTSWVNNSDRNLKENFADLNATEVLEKIVAMPIGSWSYKSQPGEKHIGPMAQDFHAAFALGDSDRSISTVDEGGVALAAIQGLNRKVEDGNQEAEVRGQRSEARMQRLEQTLEQKETEITELKQRLAKLEQLMNEKIGGSQ